MKTLNQKGQFVVEGILLMVVSLAIFLAAMRTFNDSKALDKMVSGPWDAVAGMIESGNWAPPDQAAKNHPNQKNRNLTLNPTTL